MTKQDNYFITLNKIEWETSEKQWLTYISWANAWDMVKREHPAATYTIYENNEWYPFWSSKFGIDVKVWVTIPDQWETPLRDIEHIVRLPVMNGANKAMKEEKYTYDTKYKKWLIVEAATTFDINKTIQRALTKAIAMHWVWLYVYRGEDLPLEEEPLQEEVEKPEFTEEIFEVMKEKTDFTNYFEAKANIDAKYNLSLWMAKKVKAYYESKDKWATLDDEWNPPF